MVRAVRLVLAVAFVPLSPARKSFAPHPPRSRFAFTRSPPVVLKLSALFALYASEEVVHHPERPCLLVVPRFGVDPATIGPSFSVFVGANLLAGMIGVDGCMDCPRIGLVEHLVSRTCQSNILLILVPLMPNAQFSRPSSSESVQHSADGRTPLDSPIPWRLYTPRRAFAASGVNRSGRSVGAGSPRRAGTAFCLGNPLMELSRSFFWPEEVRCLRPMCVIGVFLSRVLLSTNRRLDSLGVERPAQQTSVSHKTRGLRHVCFGHAAGPSLRVSATRFAEACN